MWPEEDEVFQNLHDSKRGKGAICVRTSGGDIPLGTFDFRPFRVFFCEIEEASDSER